MGALMLVAAGRVELPHPYGYLVLNQARLPFRHAANGVAGGSCTPNDSGHNRVPLLNWATATVLILLPEED